MRKQIYREIVTDINKYLDIFFTKSSFLFGPGAYEQYYRIL